MAQNGCRSPNLERALSAPSTPRATPTLSRRQDTDDTDGYYGSVEILSHTEEQPVDVAFSSTPSPPRGHFPLPRRQLLVGGRLPSKPVRIRSSSLSEFLYHIRQPAGTGRRNTTGVLVENPFAPTPDRLDGEPPAIVSPEVQGNVALRSISPGTPRQRLGLLASLSIVNFTSFCCLSILAPFFPKEVSAKGLSVSVAGAIFSVYSFVNFISPPFLGKLMPHVGTKFMFLAGSFLCGGCSILFGFVYLIENPITFVTYCVVIRSLEALGAAAFQTAAFTFAILYFPDNLSSVMGAMETFVGIGLSVGPALGGVPLRVGWVCFAVRYARNYSVAVCTHQFLFAAFVTCFE